MMSAIRGEFRKIFSIRSTYLFILFGIAMTLLFAFYGEGLKYKGPTDNPLQLQNEIINAVNALSLFVALIGVLLVTHEYRYNTIMYTLTTSNSRTKTLFAKLIAVTCVTLLLTLFYATLSPLLAALGLQISGTHLVHQVFYFRDIWWRVLLYGWGYTMYGLILAVTIRNQIGAIVALFLTQATVEPLIGLVFKSAQEYMPFFAINKLLSIQVDGPPVSYAKPATTVAVYIVVGWILSWILFVKRDAN